MFNELEGDRITNTIRKYSAKFIVVYYSIL